MTEATKEWPLLMLFLALLVLPGCGRLSDDSASDKGPAITMPAASSEDSVPNEVTQLTPAQQEGPYYPVEKPADRDNDLVNLVGAAGSPVGEVLHLAGVVYNAAGQPVEGALIEIWQTDASGVYLHPDDPGTDGRDPNFQFYGESLTGADGVYGFRTILPGRYEPRPRHIHVKVKMNGEELLTTQFYFESGVDLSGEQAQLVAKMAPAEDDAGNPVWVAERDIFLSLAQ
jgi:protocatechuate 3,4-dioxygenase beta subunit